MRNFKLALMAATSYDMAGLTFSGDSDIGANNSMSNTIHVNVTNTNTFKLRLSYYFYG